MSGDCRQHYPGTEGSTHGLSSTYCRCQSGSRPRAPAGHNLARGTARPRPAHPVGGAHLPRGCWWPPPSRRVQRPGAGRPRAGGGSANEPRGGTGSRRWGAAASWCRRPPPVAAPPAPSPPFTPSQRKRAATAARGVGAAAPRARVRTAARGGRPLTWGAVGHGPRRCHRRSPPCRPCLPRPLLMAPP